MNKSSGVKPIQLISFDSDKNLVLSHQAAEIFNRMDTSQLYVVIVAGKYRTGKSYILNRVLLNQNSGFQVGPTINACTKGLWMWPELVQITDNKGRTKDCVIIDTEGLGSLQQGQNTDIKIFLMAVLLSSYLIYNSVGNIDEKALQNLSLVINLAEMLHKQNNQYDAQQLINAFPSFMWLVRDFSLRLQDQNGQQINSKQYLQLALKYQNSNSNAAQRKNLIRKKLKNFFQERNCFTLIRPTQNQKDLQNLSKLPEKKLRPEFVNLIHKFKETIYQQLRPKKVRGKIVTPQGFIELCKYFVDMINSGKLPSINSHWDNICVKQSSRLIDTYKQNHYNALIDEIQSDNQQLDEMNIDKKLNKLNNKHRNILEEAYLKIDKSFLGKLEKDLSKERLEKSLTKIYDQVIEKVNEDRFSKVREIVSQIFTEIVIEFSENKLESFEQIFARFEEIKQKYKHDTSIYQSFYENSKDVFQEFLRNLKNQWRKDNQILNERNGYLQNQIQAKTAEIKQKINKYCQQNRELQLKNYKCLLELEKKNNEIVFYKNQLSRIIQQKQALEESIEDGQISKYQSVLQQLQQSKTQSKQKATQWQKNKTQLQIQIAKLGQSLKSSQIKQRKNQRQMEIFKNKCSEYLKQNISLTEEIQSVKKQLLASDKQSRKPLFFKSDQQNENNQELTNFIKSLNSKIDELEARNNAKEQENRNLNKLIANQSLAYETLLKTPQNMNYQLLKKNYESQCINNKRSEKKLKELERILFICSYRCMVCKNKNQFNDQQSIKQHLKNCVQNRQIDFDVSYEYNSNGDIEFMIDVIIDNYQHQWTIRKTLKSIRLFLRKMHTVFLQFQESRLFASQMSTSLINQEQDQQKRVYLSEIFNQYRWAVWSQIFMLQFFAFDIHYLNEKNLPIKLEVKNQSIKSSKGSKFSSELSLDISDLADQNMDPCTNLMNQGSNLLMRTCKFSKKTFNFGSYL